jgi:hypothetical protein
MSTGRACVRIAPGAGRVKPISQRRQISTVERARGAYHASATGSAGSILCPGAVTMSDVFQPQPAHRYYQGANSVFAAKIRNPCGAKEG